jgi:hypothetical protein
MPVDAYNGFEAVLWTVLAVVVAIRYRNSVAGLRRISAITSVLLVLFSVSDVVEMSTGAWWRPPELLVLKGFCLVGLVWCFRRLLRGSAAQRIRSGPASDGNQNQPRMEHGLNTDRTTGPIAVRD